MIAAGHRAGEGLPSSRRHRADVPRPIRRGVPRGCTPGSSPLPWPSPRIRGARHSLAPTPRAGPLTTPQASRDATDRPLAPPSQGLRRWASTRPVSRPGRQPATGPPGSYPDRTHTGRRRRAYEPWSPTRGHLQFRWAHESSGLVTPPVVDGGRLDSEMPWRCRPMSPRGGGRPRREGAVRWVEQRVGRASREALPRPPARRRRSLPGRSARVRTSVADST